MRAWLDERPAEESDLRGARPIAEWVGECLANAERAGRTRERGGNGIRKRANHAAREREGGKPDPNFKETRPCRESQTHPHTHTLSVKPALAPKCTSRGRPNRERAPRLCRLGHRSWSGHASGVGLPANQTRTPDHCVAQKPQKPLGAAGGKRRGSLDRTESTWRETRRSSPQPTSERERASEREKERERESCWVGRVQPRNWAPGTRWVELMPMTTSHDRVGWSCSAIGRGDSLRYDRLLAWILSLLISIRSMEKERKREERKGWLDGIQETVVYG